MRRVSKHEDSVGVARAEAAEWAQYVIARAGVGPECASLLRFLAATINERWECPWNTQYLAVALNERESEVKHHLDVLGEQHAVYRFVSNLDGQPASVPFTLNRFYPQRANVWGREPWLWR